MSRKLLLVALVALLVASASAWHTDSVEACVKRQRCWTKGHRAVCGVSPHGKRVGFPNRCYYACQNMIDGGHWHIKYWYTPRHHCKWDWNWRCAKC